MTIHSGVVAGTIEYSSISYVPDWIGEVVTGTDPSVWESSFVVKTTHASTQPIVEANPVHHNAQRALSFVDDFYNRIIIDPTIIDVGNLVSDQFYEIQVFNGYFENKDLQTLTTEDADGLLITGGVPPVTFLPLETKTYQLTISTEGPPSINAKIRFDFAGISDASIISVIGGRIVMLPYQANLPWSEDLEWKTNVLTTNDGSEQRIRLRKNARQSVSANYSIPSRKLAQAYNMAYGWRHRTWAVGLWSEIQYVGAVSPGATSINCITDTFDIRAGGLICLWESVEHNEVFEVESVFADNISLKRVMNGDYSNAYLIPVRIGMIRGNVRRSSNGHQSSLSMEYEFKDNTNLISAAPAQYAGYDIYYEETLMPSDFIEDNIISRIDVVDFETGTVDYFPPWAYNRVSRNALFLNENPEESWNFKKWLHRRAGRLRPYWLPTFENNLRVKMDGNVASSIICHFDNYKGLGEGHNHLAIQLNDGSWLPCHVSGVSLDNSETINVAIDITLNVDASTIKRISFLTLHRLDTDRVTIDWIGNGVNQSSIKLIEFRP